MLGKIAKMGRTFAIVERFSTVCKSPERSQETGVGNQGEEKYEYTLAKRQHGSYVGEFSRAWEFSLSFPDL